MHSPVLNTLKRVGTQSTSSAFWKLMHQVAIASGATHVTFMGLFYGMGATTMAWVNLGSVMLFAASYFCLRRRWNLLASNLMTFEIVAHATVAVRAIGWDSGFHYYLLLVVPVVVISCMKYPVFKPILVGAICAVYLALDYTMHGLTPWDVVTPQVLSALRYFNISAVFLLLTILAHLYLQMITRAEAKLRLLATTDPLTQLLNRRSVMEIAEYEHAQYQHHRKPLAFVLGDVDHFKAINDRYGHAAGDAVLAAVSRALKDTVRDQDSVARWGGEEFLIVMPNATVETATLVAQRVRERVAAIEVPVDEHLIKVSMTFGVSGHRPQQAPDVSITRADAAMYCGKLNGRNQVVEETPRPMETRPGLAG
jgi:diguanylate cyclase (GGDEF)-like protein